MEINEEKTVDMLTTDSVSILTQKFIEIDGEKTQVGGNHRCSYINSKDGRKFLIDEEPNEIVNAVFVIWGDEPTIVFS